MQRDDDLLSASVEFLDAGVSAGIEVALQGATTPVPVLRAIGMFFKAAAGETPTERLIEAERAERRAAISRRADELQANIAKLVRDGVPVNLSDFIRVTEHASKAWSQAADAKKRSLIEDALVNSFDPELYESGLLNTLWGCIDRLSYGDLVLLRAFVDARPDDLPSLRKESGLTNQESLGAFHASALMREGLAWNALGHPPAGALTPTDLGRRLRALAWTDATTATKEGGDSA